MFFWKKKFMGKLFLNRKTAKQALWPCLARHPAKQAGFFLPATKKGPFPPLPLFFLFRPNIYKTYAGRRPFLLGGGGRRQSPPLPPLYPRSKPKRRKGRLNCVAPGIYGLLYPSLLSAFTTSPLLQKETTTFLAAFFSSWKPFCVCVCFCVWRKCIFVSKEIAVCMNEENATYLFIYIFQNCSTWARTDLGRKNKIWRPIISRNQPCTGGPRCCLTRVKETDRWWNNNY